MPESITPAAAAVAAARDTLTTALELLSIPPGDSYGRRRGKRQALGELAVARRALDTATVALVAELRATGLYSTWEEIGAALGVSKQAARERFGRQGIT